MADAILLNDLRGGRNGFDPPHLLRNNQVVEAVNVDYYGASLARRRGGSVQVSLTGGTAFTNTAIDRLYRFIPAAAETDAELWALGRNGTDVLVKRLAGGTTWANVTGGDQITLAQRAFTETATLDGRLYVAAPLGSGASRILAYDPSLSAPQLRLVGFTTPGSPTTGNTGSGSYPAVIRWYRVRWIQISGSVIVRRSEPGTSTSFTPSGSGTAARVTQPTPPAPELMTHWEVEASIDNTNFYVLAQVVIATTTYDDSALVATYSANTLSPLLGEYATWPSVRFLISDTNRLIGAGSHISTEKSSRIYFSAVLGSTDQGDAERVPRNTIHNNYVDLNEKDGGGITGLAYSMNGSFYAFKRRQVWRISPTGDDVTPYLPRLVTSAAGTVSHASIIAGRDEYGNPAIYFWGEEGPYRIVVQGDGASLVQYLGNDIRDLSTQNSLGYAAQTFPHAVYFPALHQVWFWFAYDDGGSNVYPVKAVFDVSLGVVSQGNEIRGGWTIHTNFTAASTTPVLSHVANASVMFPKTLGASMTGDLVPYVAPTYNLTILRCNTTDTTDNSVAFQAYIKTKPLDLMPFGENVGLGVGSMLADPAAGVPITLSYIRDYGLETRAFSITALTAAASETKVIKKFEDADMSGAGVVQIQLGDITAASVTQWKLHELSLTVYPQEPR